MIIHHQIPRRAAMKGSGLGRRHVKRHNRGDDIVRRQDLSQSLRITNAVLETDDDGPRRKCQNLLRRAVRVLALHAEPDDIRALQTLRVGLEINLRTVNWLALKMRQAQAVFRNLPRISRAPN